MFHTTPSCVLNSGGRPWVGDPYARAVAVDRDDRQGIQSVEIAMTVLLALEKGVGAMSLTQVSTGSGMASSKVHRYLVSLCRVGLVTQSPTSGLYDLGPALRRLGAEALRRIDEASVAGDHVRALRDRTKHTTGMHVWGEHGPVLIRWETGGYLLPMTTRVGSTVPLVTTSAGRVFLTHLPATLTDPVLRTARDSGQCDLTDDQIEEIKTDVRRTGVAIATNAVIPGVSSIAAPVFNAEGDIPLTVLIGIPNALATPVTMRSLSAELLATTRTISAELGTDRGAAAAFN